MTLTYRTSGPWGAGKGGVLTVSEGDQNIWTLKQAIDAIAADVPSANNIIGFSQNGPLLTLTMSDGSEIGPITLPVAPYAAAGVTTVSAATYAPTTTNVFVECTNATGCVVTLPLNATVSLPVGTELSFAQAAAGPVSVVAASGVTVNKRVDRAAATDTAGAVIMAKKIATDTWRLFGDLADAP